MAVEVSKTTVLDAADVQKDNPIDSSDFKDIMKSVNAVEEQALDTACHGGGAGGGGQTEDGHNHDADGNGRGIMRAVCGGFQIQGSPMNAGWEYLAPGSMALDVAYVNMYEPCSTAGNLLNYIMGKAVVSSGITEIRVELCMKTETLNYRPQVRVKNLTDSTLAKEYASAWIDLDAYDPHWYGTDETTEKITVPVEPDTTPREIDLDIEVRLASAQGVGESFLLYSAFPYEFNDQPV